jgi:hypothetical protein
MFPEARLSARGVGLWAFGVCSLNARCRKPQHSKRPTPNAARRKARLYHRTGSSITTRNPGLTFSAWIRPPCSSIAFRAMARPRPVPVDLVEK